MDEDPGTRRNEEAMESSDLSNQNANSSGTGPFLEAAVSIPSSIQGPSGASNYNLTRDQELDADESDSEVMDEQSEDSGSANEEGDDDDDVSLMDETAKPQKVVKVNQNLDSIFGDFSFATSSDVINSADPSEGLETLRADAEKWVGHDICTTSHVDTQKTFVCVDYPGIIRNCDKALATLGGVSGLMKARNKEKLELRFRPDDPYCKATIGVNKMNNHLLLRCLRRKVKGFPCANDEKSDGYEYKVEVVGIVEGIFSFKRPCDFQYLPVVKKPDGSGYKEILSELIFRFDEDRDSFINKDMPLFLPPYVFSRSERPGIYLFQDDESKDHDHIGLTRKLRCKGTQRLLFSAKEVPDVPNELALERYHNMAKHTISLEPLKKIFEERPMWSRTGILARLREKNNIHLKDLINCVAYVFTTGPWMHLWCKFGFDPRKEPSAKLYQTVDFRVRKPWNRDKVIAKRSCDHFKGVLGRAGNTLKGHRLPSMNDLNPDIGDSETPLTSQESKAWDTSKVNLLYQFVPDQLPPYRQMIYQVCDIFEDKIQALLHQNDGQEVECTERDGWCISDFVAMSRDIINKHSERLYTAQSHSTGEDKTDLE